MQFKSRHGVRGLRVLRHDWRTWKRIAQTRRGHRWTPAKAPAQTVIDRVYRQDGKAKEDWRALVDPMAAGPKAQTDNVTGQEQVQYEYISSVLKKGAHYAIKTHAGPVREGESPLLPEVKHFQYIDAVTSRARPSVMPTVESAEDMVLSAALALNIQHERVWTPPPNDGEQVEAPTDKIEIYRDGVPEWVRPFELGPFGGWWNNLYSYKASSSANVGCLVLRDETRVVNTIPIMDERCPTLCIADYLRKTKWHAVTKLVRHTTQVPGEFDAFEAVKMKQYYQVLCVIPRCIALSSTIPSRQPVAYYRSAA